MKARTDFSRKADFGMVPVKELINPLIADRYLKTSRGNRSVRKWWIDELSKMIGRGEFQLTHQGIAFDSDGVLLDGHHRLRAIIQSNREVWMFVWRHAKKDTALVIDGGIKRTDSDTTGWDVRVSNIISLGAGLVYGGRYSKQQLINIAHGDFYNYSMELINHCGSSAKIYSSAPLKLAAVVSMMEVNGGIAACSYQLQQYAALCHYNIKEMSVCSQAFIRQVSFGKINTVNRGDLLARGLKLFDYNNRYFTKIQISDDTIKAAREYVVMVLKSRTKK